MTSKRKFDLLESCVIYGTKEYQKDVTFVNIQNKNERIGLKQLLLDIEIDLEVLEILKKYLHYSKSYYNNQADYGCAEITLKLEQDNIWLNDEERTQLKKDFIKVKEWLENASRRNN